MGTTCLSKKDLDSGSLSNISEERRHTIMTIKDGIALESESILDFGNAASKNLTEFSSDLLSKMKLKDTPEVETLLSDLLKGLDQIDASTLLEKKPTFFQRLFGEKVDVKKFIMRYEDISSVITEIKSKLEVSTFQLKKDMEVCSRYLEQNLNYINALDDYIMAGRIKVNEEQSEIDAERAVIDREDMLAVNQLNARQSNLDRLERKVHDLNLMRAIAIQNIPQIMLIRDGDGVLVEKIQSSINSAIPLWESQMVIAIQLMRQKGALTIQKSVTDTTNNLIARNSELLESGTVEVAKELERGIVDVEVLKKSSENLIKTLESLKQIRENGRKERIKATAELAALQSRLNEQLLLQGG